ncbi:MAG: phenylalanine--tRNA ligase subunit alpha, partial [Armatimonadetes bacterium]|nr:phenylalanine--tRNA ligase subunit alpha [Armatimonadota bacterium]
MIEEVEAVLHEARQAIPSASNADELEQLRVRYLGRKGLLRQFTQKIAELPLEQRREAGEALNRARRTIEALIERRQAELQAVAEAERLAAERLDVTLPGRAPRIGHRHPLLATLEEMVEIFLGMGFTVAEGPEVETYYYSFPALNYPEWHPAMDEQMTFYITDDLLLRSQTSTVQIRVMESQQPPVRIVVPGRCFRRDTPDATHSHTFYQLEGLLV